MCLFYLASFAQIIKPLKTQYASINGDSNLISSCSSSPPVNEHEKVGAYSSSSPPSHEEVDVNDDDEVYELEFGKTTNLSDSRPKPVAKPRRRVDRTRHGSAPGLKIMENGLESHDQSQESTASKEVKARDVSHDQHPTPSRSAPAPPNATGEATSNDRVSEMIVDCTEDLNLSLSLPLSSNSQLYRSLNLDTSSQDMPQNRTKSEAWNQNLL